MCASSLLYFPAVPNVPVHEVQLSRLMKIVVLQSLSIRSKFSFMYKTVAAIEPFIHFPMPYGHEIANMGLWLLVVYSCSYELQS